MQVILLEKMKNLGELGDAVRVKPGYARNFLIPQGKAIPATPQNVAEFEARRAELERQEAEALAAAKARAEQIEGTVVTIARKTGEEGKLFGSVGTHDIVEAMAELGTEVRRQDIRLPGETLRQVGEYKVGVHLFADVEATIDLIIVPEE